MSNPLIPLPLPTSLPRSTEDASDGTENARNPPRPMNTFMVFRKKWFDDYRAKFTKGDPVISQSKISKMIAKEWHQTPSGVKRHFEQLSVIAKEEHAIKYPNYKYRPKLKGQNGRTRARDAAKDQARKATKVAQVSAMVGQRAAGRSRPLTANRSLRPSRSDVFRPASKGRFRPAIPGSVIMTRC